MLYVARDRRRPSQHDLGSILCLRVLELLPPGAVQVRESDARDRSAWLTGTPTLVLDHEILRGHQALDRLQRLAVDAAAPPPPAKGRPLGARGAVPPMAQPPAATAALLAPQQAPPPARGPEATEEEDDAVSLALWESHIDEDEEEENDDALPRKITSDDLARHMSARNGTASP